MPKNPRTKLRRLPHVFGQVLELPLQSHADVIIEDRSDCFRFTANIANNGFRGAVRAHAVNIYPGVTKVVVREGNGSGNGEVELWLDKLEVDVWRFRFPDATRPWPEGWGGRRGWLVFVKNEYIYISNMRD